MDKDIDITKQDKLTNSYYLIGLLNEFINRFTCVSDNYLEEISWKQCFLIICIDMFTYPPTIKEVSEVMGCSHQNVKQMLLKLCKLKYIDIEIDKADKRKQRIVALEKIKKVSESNNARRDRFMDLLYKDINKDELLITIQTIMKMDKSLKKINIEEI